MRSTVKTEKMTSKVKSSVLTPAKGVVSTKVDCILQAYYVLSTSVPTVSLVGQEINFEVILLCFIIHADTAVEVFVGLIPVCFLSQHLGCLVVDTEELQEMVCEPCMDKASFLWTYAAHFAGDLSYCSGKDTPGHLTLGTFSLQVQEFTFPL